VSGLALLFPGQGSQDVGMGRDLAETYPVARRVFDDADAILGFSLSGLCFEGPRETLDDTINTQPALFVTSLAVLRVLQAAGRLPRPAAVAGHSMGELTALVAAGAMDFEAGLRLVRERGRLMKLAGEQNPGGMAAVIKMDDADVEKACRDASDEIGAPVQIANYNAPGQIVISGNRQALARAIALLQERGAKRILPLAVSIAAHSPLMAVVVEEYRACIEATTLSVPDVPIYANISARPLTSVAEIRDELAGQLTWPVRWTASVQAMAAAGITRFVEVGPKQVLSGLVKRIEPAVEAQSLGDVPTVQAWTP
jgi:[acyl-carrier-protein] S-malonyltransferase